VRIPASVFIHESDVYSAGADLELVSLGGQPAVLLFPDGTVDRRRAAALFEMLRPRHEEQFRHNDLPHRFVTAEERVSTNDDKYRR
jgi:hypothetical protein